MYSLIIFICVVRVLQLNANELDTNLTDRPIIQLQKGQIQGIKNNNTNGHTFYAFRGVPYATPPVGDLRFKDPVPVEPWSGVRDAQNFGANCVQIDPDLEEVKGNEDCLFLNVYTSDLNSSKPRAVMVWIHGGSFEFGSGDDDYYGPDYLIEKNIVLVTLNYRLDILGFLNLDDEEASGNQGLKDIVMALNWTQQNIENFNGDPKRITIFGQSAGGAAVHYLTLSPLAKGLFHRAILQSGVATNPWASRSSKTMKQEIKEKSENFGNVTGDTKQLIKYLKSVDAKSLVEAQDTSEIWENIHMLGFLFVPSTDTKSKNPFLNIPIEEAAKKGVNVPSIIGYTSHEAISFITEFTDKTYEKMEANHETMLLHDKIIKLLKSMNISVSDIYKFYMGNKKVDRENIEQLIDLFSAGIFVINIHDLLSIQSSIKNVKTYFYKFDYYSEDSAIMQEILDLDIKGTSHGEDLFYLFYSKIAKSLGLLSQAIGSPEDKIKQRFVELWTNFAKTGDPNSEISELLPIEWKPLNDNSNNYDCLKISEDLSMIKETSIFHQIKNNNNNKRH